MTFKHYAFTLPEEVPFDLIKERVGHALESGREVFEVNDYHDGPDSDLIATADAHIDMCREAGIDPLTGSERHSAFDYMDHDEGEDPSEDWEDEEDEDESHW